MSRFLTLIVALHYVSVFQDEVENAFLRNWQGLIAEMPAPLVDDHLNRQADDLNGEISAKVDHLEAIEMEMVGGKVQSAARAARRIEEELRTLRIELGKVQERIEMADRGLVATRLEGLREILEPEEGEVDRARVNAALRVLFEGVTIDHRTGFLRFHWRQGGETGLMYAWRD